MCGIIGLLLANEAEHVNQLLFDGLTVLQHRGQDAAGIVTSEKGRLHLRKDNGLVKDVFYDHHMLELRGNVGLGHCRYPTAGTSSCAEAQPLYTNYPYGISVAHNGNLTNADELTRHLSETVGRHVNTDSDSELLLNVFAEALTKETFGQVRNNNNTTSANNGTNGNSKKEIDMKEAIFGALAEVMTQCKGGYAGLFLVNGFGLVGFRDPHGIRPLVFGSRKSSTSADTDGSKLDYVICSESVAIDTLGFKLDRDVGAGEAIFIDFSGNCSTRIVAPEAILSPCIFEYVYFARPDTILDGISVYETRLKMGEKLAHKILRLNPNHDIDVVIPIPDTSRTSALQAAYFLNRPFREGFIKNRYIARTFIMPGQATRKKSVRLKLNTIKPEFNGKNVLLVDDSIVRGTTANEIVQMARDAGAKKVYFCSAAPPIRYPNIYGIDIPTRDELVAYNRNEDEIAHCIGCDWVVYQDLKDLEDSILESAPVLSSAPTIHRFDCSCFSGEYVTGEHIGDKYFQKLQNMRSDDAKEKRKSVVLAQNGGSTQKPRQSYNGCEGMSNDKRIKESIGGDACESVMNQPNGCAL